MHLKSRRDWHLVFGSQSLSLSFSLHVFTHTHTHTHTDEGISGAADTARSVAQIEMKLGTELRLFAG